MMRVKKKKSKNTQFPKNVSVLRHPSFFWSISSYFCCSVSPLSLLFFALSDISQDINDEDSEEEEDFAQVQFGSRYTTAQCVLLSALTCLLVG